MELTWLSLSTWLIYSRYFDAVDSKEAQKRENVDLGLNIWIDVIQQLWQVFPNLTAKESSVNATSQNTERYFLCNLQLFLFMRWRIHLFFLVGIVSRGRTCFTTRTSFSKLERYFPMTTRLVSYIINLKTHTYIQILFFLILKNQITREGIMVWCKSHRFILGCVLPNFHQICSPITERKL